MTLGIWFLIGSIILLIVGERFDNDGFTLLGTVGAIISWVMIGLEFWGYK